MLLIDPEAPKTELLSFDRQPDIHESESKRIEDSKFMVT
jgi:hypothetical protein